MADLETLLASPSEDLLEKLYQGAANKTLTVILLWFKEPKYSIFKIKII